ncbi:thermonuclease family protein [Azospirillum doebereinerae]|uniref:thermonuclease family protein n=1 Tax=Azospirillum doebereinerae TaxID=92933 RepID=UPI001EE5081E|nr:thermonuclease family protein [Azospirillum doebereinerae]MCG5241989.1 thermonuclease family protein [Azospirillum doebereinerae]
MHALRRRMSPAALSGLAVAVCVVLGTALWAVEAGGAPATLPGPIPAEVVAVVDGDTLTVRAIIWLGQSVETNVRLDGVDAPEMRAHCPQEKALAESAREAVRGLVGAGLVHLLDVQPDKYGGRVRARIRVAGGGDLTEALLRTGLVRPYHGERRRSWCEEADPS